MSLEPGRKLGPYEILAPLGAGGMGEVYRARDTRLDRDVAIKVLPAHLTADETARQRLEREAKAVSALSHPNICTLYDVGHDGDVDYLVIEYLEGETLAQRLAREPLATNEMLSCAIQIADALDKAHRGGVVHRDLKPGNIMLTRQGAKLLDFGLAKSMSGPGEASNLTVAPTATSPLTMQGAIVGTFQYMAPEQLEGQEADVRSDIFAFGSVLFEMITGKTAFEGKTQAGLIAAIIERDPPVVSTLQPLTSPALDRLVRTCLAKDPEERRQSMHDVLLDLRWIADAGSQAGVPAPVTRRRRLRASAAWGVAALFALTSVALGWSLLARPDTEPPPRVVSQLLSPEGVQLRARGMALSPDGRVLAFCASKDDGPVMLWVRHLDSGISRALPSTENSWSPFWSPDSRSVGFFSDDGLRRIQVDGGSSLKIADAPFGAGGSWNKDGVIVYTPSYSAGLFRVAAAGGETVRLTEPENAVHVGPVFLPDGQRFLYFVSDRESVSSAVQVGSLDGSVDEKLVQSESPASYVAGHLVYVAEDTLIAQRLDLGQMRLLGDPRVIAEPVGSYATNARGMLAYAMQRGAGSSQLTGYDRDGQQQQVIVSETRMDDLALSPDGTRLAVRRNDLETGDDYDIWTYDLGREIFTRVTFDGRADDPVWSPDGKWIIYSRNPTLYRVRSNGTGQPDLVLDSETDDVCHDWSRDGREVLFSRYADDGDHLDLWSFAVDDDNEARPILSGKANEWQAEFSPDGRLVAYASDESGETQVYVQSWPDLTEKWQISRSGGSMPRWRADGRELYFVSPDRELVAVQVITQQSGFVVGDESVLFETRMSAGSRSTDYVVTPDGAQFLFIEAPRETDDGPVPITLVQEFLSSPEGG